MITSIQKMRPEGETQMTTYKLSTSWARRLHREMGDEVWFPLPGYGGVQEGLKRSAALPFPPVGARWLGGKGYGTWGGRGCTTEGRDSVGRKVAFQPMARSACWGGGSCGFPCPPSEVEAHLVNIYIQSKMHGHFWEQGGRPGDSLLPGEHPLPRCPPCPLPLCLWPPLLQHRGMRCQSQEGRVGCGGNTYLFAASCVGERGS